MSAELDRAVELLSRAIASTCPALGAVRREHLPHPTPCRAWSLAGLLAHMEDALDAFTEAAGGLVDVRAAPVAGAPVERLQVKAGALLGAWRRATPPRVAIGGAALSAPVLVGAAALEVAVHGWDVGVAAGRPFALPDELASGLLAVASTVVHPDDRGDRFAAPVPVAPDAAPGERLLGLLGRDPSNPLGPPRAIPGHRPAGRRRAS